MIAKLKGLVDSVGDDWAVIDVQGVGYLVSGSSRTLMALPGIGEAVALHIETIVREDSLSLFGFADVQERDLFRLLTSVQGVGAKVALAILSTLSPADLQNAIAAQDKTAVARAKGVGPKVATRIVTELKDKVTGLVFQPTGVKAASVAGAPTADADNSVVADAVSALSNLGYKPMDAHAAVAKVIASLDEGADVGVIVPAALKELSAL